MKKLFVALVAVGSLGVGMMAGLADQQAATAQICWPCAWQWEVEATPDGYHCISGGDKKCSGESA